ncbi:hypothetical protein C1645_763792 [Glomus cerebriforme]|uniref:Uncharacterized protein n=1 Tax=Glomus cerebriforme TaxID=658196 RepID=A0A397T3V9_9GLOM|nr:hypothetical protein C1645_763792 [Glomus cerebriforme]
MIIKDFNNILQLQNSKIIQSLDVDRLSYFKGLAMLIEITEGDVLQVLFKLLNQD